MGTTESLQQGSARSAAAPARWLIPTVAILMATGVANDIQSVGLSPLIGTMVQDLHITAAQAGWAINITSLAGAVSIGLVSRLGDRVGHRKVLIALTAVALASSILGALANSYAVLLVARAGQGMSFGLAVGWGLLKVRATPNQIEAAALSVGSVLTSFTPVALVMGGAFLRWGWGWNSVFWVMAALNAIALGLALMVPETPVKERSTTPVDWLGAIGLGAWLFCLLLAISEGRAWGWTSGSIVGLFVAAAVLFALWVVEQRRASVPLLDLRGMNTAQVTGGFLLTNCIGVAAVSLYIAIPAMAQTPKAAAGYGFGLDVLTSSLILVPILPAALISSWAFKRLLARYGTLAPVAIGGGLLITAFTLTAFAHSHLWQLYVCVFVFALGGVLVYILGQFLVAAAGRKDNTSATFGVGVLITYPVSAVMVAITLAILTPPAGQSVPDESSYTQVFLLVAGLELLGLIIVGTRLIPRQVTHHAASEASAVPTDRPAVALD
jgi:MFS family permease